MCLTELYVDVVMDRDPSAPFTIQLDAYVFVAQNKGPALKRASCTGIKIYSKIIL